MEELNKLRGAIKKIDEQLMQLIVERLGLVGSIGELKRRLELPIEDSAYEAQKRAERDLFAKAHNLTGSELEQIFSSIIKVSRATQRRLPVVKNTTAKGTAHMRVAVMGSLGSFSEDAALDYIHRAGIKNFELTYPISAEGVLSALEAKDADIGIFPIHNSTGGLVIESIYAASEHLFSIEELFELEVRQCLHVLPGVKMEEIDRITSHPQALAQCRRYLKVHFPHAHLVEANDTATAARWLSEHPAENTTAVIAPKRCAQLYGVQLLVENIQDQEVNMTQFIAARVENEVEIESGL